jgi:thiamine phosphate synthase YjbQ (UPF0047 family)
MPSSGGHHYLYHEIQLQTRPGIALFDVTPQIRALIQQEQIQDGVVNVLSRHTTTAVTINESEPRLLDDIRMWLRRLAPASDSYLHNDLHMREAPQNWPGGWEAWAAQEPQNAHSHLLSIMLGNSQTIPVAAGKLMLGTWQSVLMVELDGPRQRTVGIQLVGQRNTPGSA